MQVFGKEERDFLNETQNDLPLPIEILTEIFLNLTFKEISHLRLVCRKWNQICSGAFISRFFCCKMFPESSTFYKNEDFSIALIFRKLRNEVRIKEGIGPSIRILREAVSLTAENNVLCMKQNEGLLYAGFQEGVIRVFDLKEEKECELKKIEFLNDKISSLAVGSFIYGGFSSKVKRWGEKEEDARELSKNSRGFGEYLQLQKDRLFTHSRQGLFEFDRDLNQVSHLKESSGSFTVSDTAIFGYDRKNCLTLWDREKLEPIQTFPGINFIYPASSLHNSGNTLYLTYENGDFQVLDLRAKKFQHIFSFFSLGAWSTRVLDQKIILGTSFGISLFDLRSIPKADPLSSFRVSYLSSFELIESAVVVGTHLGEIEIFDYSK